MFGARYYGARYFGGRFFGHVGQTIDGAYNGPRYFGNAYFGLAYFQSNPTSDPFALSVSSGPGLTGRMTTGGNVSFGASFVVNVTRTVPLTGATSYSGSPVFVFEDWAFTPPLEVPTAFGFLTVGGDLTITATAPGVGGYFGHSYFGAAYFGPRYYGTGSIFQVGVTGAVALSGETQVSGDFSTRIELSPTTVDLSGALLITGDYVKTAPGVGLNVGGHVLPSTRRRLFTVTIDGKDFVVGSEAEAMELLRRAEEEAQKRAEAAAQKAAASPKRQARKVIKQAKQELAKPSIVIPDALQELGPFREIVAKIDGIYDDALKAVAAIVQQRKQAPGDDDEEILILTQIL